MDAQPLIQHDIEQSRKEARLWWYATSVMDRMIRGKTKQHRSLKTDDTELVNATECEGPEIHSSLCRCVVCVLWR